MGVPHEGAHGAAAPSARLGTRLRGWQVARRVASVVGRAVPALRHGATRLASASGKLRTEAGDGALPGQRAADLRSEAELLSRRLLAEGDPEYPRSEANIFALEHAFGERHRR